MTVVVHGLSEWCWPGVDDCVEVMLVVIAMCNDGEEVMCMSARAFGAVLMCECPIWESRFGVDESVSPFECLILDWAAVFPPVEGG